MNENPEQEEKLAAILDELNKVKNGYIDFQKKSDAILDKQINMLDKQMETLEKTVAQVTNMKAVYDNELSVLTKRIQILEREIYPLRAKRLH